MVVFPQRRCTKTDSTKGRVKLAISSPFYTYRRQVQSHTQISLAKPSQKQDFLNALIKLWLFRVSLNSAGSFGLLISLPTITSSLLESRQQKTNTNASTPCFCRVRRKEYEARHLGLVLKLLGSLCFWFVTRLVVWKRWSFCLPFFPRSYLPIRPSPPLLVW